MVKNGHALCFYLMRSTIHKKKEKEELRKQNNLQQYGEENVNIGRKY
jgi:hypothetical protein